MKTIAARNVPWGKGTRESRVGSRSPQAHPVYQVQRMCSGGKTLWRLLWVRSGQRGGQDHLGSAACRGQETLAGRTDSQETVAAKGHGQQDTLAAKGQWQAEDTGKRHWQPRDSGRQETRAVKRHGQPRDTGNQETVAAREHGQLSDTGKKHR